MNFSNCAASSLHRNAYIVDDDNAVRRSLSFQLSSARLVTRAFASGADFLQALDELQPGIVLLDVRMPEPDGLSVLERLPERYRAMLPVIVMTAHGDLPTAVRAMKIGAKDFLEKPFADEVVIGVIEDLLAELGTQLEQLELRDASKALIDRLSPREVQVLQSLARSGPSKVVAHALGLSTRTVEMHRANLLNKLGVRTLADAVRLAYDAGVTL